MRRLTVYTRRGCHLCEELIEALEPRVRGRAEVDVVDVDSDRSLAERYGIKVPVLMAGDTEICHFVLDEAALERHLAGTPGD